MQEAGFLRGHTVRGDSVQAEINHTPSQNRAIAKKAAKEPKTGSRRRNAPTLAGDLLPRLPSPKDKK